MGRGKRVKERKEDEGQIGRAEAYCRRARRGIGRVGEGRRENVIGRGDLG